MSEFTKEWQLLQNQYDSYEKYSLVIKLFSISSLLFSIAFQVPALFVILILMVIWFQEAIWKTFQARIEQRLLSIECAIKKQSNVDVEAVNDAEIACLAFQYNSEFLKYRPSTLGLVKEYCSNAVRPTVAFPHAVLVMLYVLF